MIKTKAGFVVYGTHKDGLKDPDGNCFIHDEMIAEAKVRIRAEGIDLIENDLIIKTKEEAAEVLIPMAKDDEVESLILFTGTWIWAAHLIGALREFAKTGKGIVIWTLSGSQGWRPVGGLVLSAAMNEIGIKHRFVYDSQDGSDIKKVASYCRASALKKRMEMSTLMSFGGRGMGQTCGVADPSQWMKTFGIDIDSRDTYDLLEKAKAADQKKVDEVYEYIANTFTEPAEKNPVNDRSIRLYLALKEMKDENAFDYYTIQSFPGMGDYYTATCFAQSMMLNDGVPTSTLSDFNTALTSIIITRLGDEPIYYGDLQHIDKAKKEIKIIGDGAVPPRLANEWGVSIGSHGIPTEGSSGGMSISLVCKPGKGVLARVSRMNGKFRLTMVRCTVFVPDKSIIEDRRHECGIPLWPHAFVKVEGDIDKMLASWNNEYACLGYGECLYDDIIAFCELTGIETVLP